MNTRISLTYYWSSRSSPEWNILNPDRLINLEINNERRTSIFYLEIKKKGGSSINPDIHHSKVPSSVRPPFLLNKQPGLRDY